MMGWKHQLLQVGRTRLGNALTRLSSSQRHALLNAVWTATDGAAPLSERLYLRRWLTERHFSTWPFLPAPVELRTFGFYDAVRSVSDVPGDIVECGVGRGQTLAALARASHFFSPDKAVLGFDSFQGFPSATHEDLGVRVTELGQPTGWTDTSLQMVSEALEDHKAELVPGFFEDTIPLRLPGSISLLHVDCDLYRSTSHVICECVPRMSPGGLIIYDEYDEPRWPGATTAIDEAVKRFQLDLQYSPQLQRYVSRFQS